MVRFILFRVWGSLYFCKGPFVLPRLMWAKFRVWAHLSFVPEGVNLNLLYFRQPVVPGSLDHLANGLEAYSDSTG